VKIRETICRSDSGCSLGRIGRNTEEKISKYVVRRGIRRVNEKNLVYFVCKREAFGTLTVFLALLWPPAAIRYSNCIKHRRGWDGMSWLDCDLLFGLPSCSLYHVSCLRLESRYFLFLVCIS
jgi:hypothetical protein